MSQRRKTFAPKRFYRVSLEARVPAEHLPRRVAAAVGVTPGEVGDEAVLDRVIEEHGGTTGRQLAEVVADAKCGSPAAYRALEAAGIRACIPPTPPRGSRRSTPTTSAGTDFGNRLKVAKVVSPTAGWQPWRVAARAPRPSFRRRRRPDRAAWR